MSIRFLICILVLPCPLDARLGSNSAAEAIAQVGSTLFSNRTAATGKGTIYSQNSFCRQNNCVNPIFPALNDMPKLEALQWQCTTINEIKEYMDFCKDAVPYDPSLPSPPKSAYPVNELVRGQEDAAMTMFIYHLNGMGYDTWEYRNPSESDSDCVKSIWKMVCFTYFPRAAAGCKSGQLSMYKRPCSSSCNNYVKNCGVTCCDESVECVFSNPTYDSSGNLAVLQTGYVDQSGPSAMCTGGSKHSTNFPLFIFFSILGFHWASGSTTHAEQQRKPELAMGSTGILRCFMLCFAILTALLIQGCDLSIPIHTTGNWQKIPSYLQSYSFVPPGGTASDTVLNSCSVKNVPIQKQCGGRGYCKAFSQNSQAAQNLPLLAFCQCDAEWTDPECNTRRKSQMTAFFLSLFFGVFGADYFYLGFPLWAIPKLCTFGGLGFWWLVDIIRIGSGPVYAYDFRTAPDLPHWVAMLTLLFVCLIAAFAGSIMSYLYYRNKKRRDLANFQLRFETRNWKHATKDTMEAYGPQSHHKFTEEDFGFSGYGATLPLSQPNAQAPFANRGGGAFEL